jgi:hypothetical protein
MLVDRALGIAAGGQMVGSSVDLRNHKVETTFKRSLVSVGVGRQRHPGLA